MKRQESKTIYVAMSGGVDSSVAAALLKKRGFNVVGIFMRPWDPTVNSNSKTATSNFRNKTPITNYQLPITSCLWQQDREDAMRAASVIDIPLLTWDFSKEYKKSVTDYMIQEYKNGRTPNPDVMCNKHIKFGLFLKKALKEGADFIATGHYIRKLKNENEKLKINEPDFRLFQAKDKNKDQSYFLWTLTQKQLKHCLFPIGDYIKPEVREMAKKFGLPNHDKKDSQGVCFIGPLDMHGFLKDYIKPRKGKIIDQQGNIIGQHDGTYYYTIGQRHGLNIGNGKGPYYVTAKDLSKNIIYVGRGKDLASKEVHIAEINWIHPTWKLNFQVLKVQLPSKFDVKIRYRSKPERATLFRSPTSKHLALKFKKPVRAVTSGQSAVFYRGQELLGGSIIR